MPRDEIELPTESDPHTLRPVLFSAAAIAPDPMPERAGPASVLEGRVTLDAVTGHEVLRVAAQGLYVAFVNGSRVGEMRLTPGWTVYDDRIAAQEHRVSDLLREGENTVTLWLGDGWFRGRLLWDDNPVTEVWGNARAAIVELRRGEETLLGTGPDWRSGTAPVTRQGIYEGETFDARETASAEGGVREVTFAARTVVQECPPVRDLAPITPVERWEEEGAEVLDFGQNIAGVVRLCAEGPEGARVVVEHAEVLGPDGRIDNRNYRAADARAELILAGAPVEWRPEFTFMGFRYARLTCEGGARVTSAEAIPISSMDEAPIGTFECGVPEVNRLVLNTLWSLRGNFIEVPTDCPQRDERLGWTGDAQVFAATALWMADAHAFFRKYLRDLIADQREDGAISNFSPDPTRLRPDSFEIPAGSTGWGDVITVLPWTLWLYRGDKHALAEAWPAMTAWMDYLWSISGGPVIDPPARPGRGFTFGDWLQPKGEWFKAAPTIGDSCAATIYHAISADIVARTARLLGAADADAWEERAETVRRAFAGEFVSPSGRLSHDDQTSYALALLHDLVPGDRVEAAGARLRKSVEETGHRIGTGFIGTPAILPALTKVGAHGHAQRLLLNREAPGWLYQVERGATTIWENWAAILPDGTIPEPKMNSYNHYAYGAVCQWLFESVAGVAPDTEGPGFGRVRIDPVALPGLGHARMRYESPKGPIAAKWKIEDDRVRYRLTLPEGCEGRMAPAPHRPDTTLGGAPANGVLTLGPGTHEIGWRLPSEWTDQGGST